ncbi:MAG TPA: class I SAM-dependent methyltransferase [Aggregatilinea sp.]|uniref:class I SAM-dependent methyltransferase n=1 Tax=Aggregatilinea sp. TaxID=2806333 RepID=UPI002CD9DD1C|nr:class I SAM-dependent methyltransferase [Aggregatilinea sp.]HML20203.1 class I SAM-dependent methyltransferase [Aggregatilinea sp.]
MQPTQPLDHALKSHANARFQRFSQSPLRDLSAPSEAFCTLPAPYLGFLADHAPAVHDWLDVCVTGRDARQRSQTLTFFVGSMTHFIQAKNQFIPLGREQVHTLTDIYDVFLADFRDTLRPVPSPRRLGVQLRQVLAAHQADLEQFVRDLAHVYGSDFVFSEPVCHEYSPALQLSLLHAPLDRLAEPVLDLGCGPRGQLVRHLARQGKTVVGIDRAASPDALLLQADWLDFPLEPGTWGTIISHMALSNHFLHHHLRQDGHPEQYACVYMAALHALKPGGSFYYTPGLPFIEDLLPRGEFSVERFPVTELNGTPTDRLFRDQLGVPVLYACKITRRG